MEFYEKACKLFVDYSIDTELEYSENKVILSVGNETETFGSFRDMYYGLEVYIALLNDIEEEPSLLQEFTELEIEQMKADEISR